MEDSNGKIFLTEQEAKRAIGIDFQQYGTQPRLFRELSPLVLGQAVIQLNSTRQDDIWIKQKRNNHLRRISDDALGELLWQALTANSYPLTLLARICALTFQVKTHTGVKPGTTTRGIWIDSDMDKFRCAQCGHCCQNLARENECTHEDYRRWQSPGLEHILERVWVQDHGPQGMKYIIWVKPGTHEVSPVCPWLVPSPEKGRFMCAIQNVKPETCRQYPLTRKHARMTGCRGSFKPHPGNSSHGN